MAYLVHNLPPHKTWLRLQYMYDNQSHHGEFERCVLITAKCIPGRAIEFEVLTERGVLRDKLPIEALCHSKDAPLLPTEYLELWNAFSYNFTVIQKSWLNRCSVFTKDKKHIKGQYLWTFDFSGEHPNLDFSLAEEPSEHKCLHFIALDNGCYALQPNNKVRWYEPTLITKPFPEHPDYKVATQAYDCERGDDWHTEDSDRWAYDIVDKKVVDTND